MRGWLDALRVGPMRSRRSAVGVLLPVVLLTEASGICVHTEVQTCWFSKVLYMGVVLQFKIFAFFADN